MSVSEGLQQFENMYSSTPDSAFSNSCGAEYFPSSGCDDCWSVYAGCWKWTNVPEAAKFPDGFHQPSLMTADCLQRRWFFATPQVIFEVNLLQYLIGLVARGGLSFTAFAVVYIGLWLNSVAGTKYGQRTHFLSVLEVVMIVYGAILMLLESGVPFQTFTWHLRPHHQANDFQGLMALVKEAFSVIVSSHDCWLFRRVRGVILDGKWSIQTRVCNHRSCNPVFSKSIQEGYYKGCVERPVRGSLYCRKHLDEVTCDLCDQEDQGQVMGKITAHRKKVGPSSVRLEYHIDGKWTSEPMPRRLVRDYEEHLLRKHVALPEHECNKDARKGVGECFLL